MKKNTRKNNKGFSLVELIIVIAIMAILAGVLAPQFIKYLGKSRISTDIQNAQQIASAVSAQISEDGTKATKSLTYTASGAIANTKISGNANLTEVCGGAPAVKVDADYTYYVEADAAGKVTVTVSDGTNSVELYPTTPGTSATGEAKKWAN